MIVKLIAATIGLIMRGHASGQSLQSEINNQEVIMNRAHRKVKHLLQFDCQRNAYSQAYREGRISAEVYHQASFDLIENDRRLREVNRRQ